MFLFFSGFVRVPKNRFFDPCWVVTAPGSRKIGFSVPVGGLQPGGPGKSDPGCDSAYFGGRRAPGDGF